MPQRPRAAATAHKRLLRYTVASPLPSTGLSPALDPPIPRPFSVPPNRIDASCKSRRRCACHPATSGAPPGTGMGPTRRRPCAEGGPHQSQGAVWVKTVLPTKRAPRPRAFRSAVPSACKGRRCPLTVQGHDHEGWHCPSSIVSVQSLHKHGRIFRSLLSPIAIVRCLA